MFTFDDLKDLTLSELLEIKNKTSDELVMLRQRRWDAIAAILFYQDEIKKEFDQ